MSAKEHVLTDAIRAGRRLVESFPDVDLLSDLRWFPEVSAWGMQCRITIASANTELIPPSTNWWILVESEYPHGKVKFYPASDGGIQLTFPHQSYNGLEKGSLPWRTGDICIRTPQFAFARAGYDPDPIGHEERLGWYLKQATDWLRAASLDDLLSDGDHFELPVFPPVSLKLHTIAYCESFASFQSWQSCEQRFGTAELVRVGEKNSNTLAIRKFFDARGEQILQYNWGTVNEHSSRSIQPAVWLRIDHLPVLPPYQAPMNWGELRNIFSRNGGSLDSDLHDALDLIRDGHSHFLLLGFPIPRRVGQSPDRLHWQPILLPVASHGIYYANGFRPNSTGYWRRDRAESFRSRDTIDWHESENWDKEEATRRGRVTQRLADIKVAVIGVGAVGSALSEMIVRAGVTDIVLIDDDQVHQGNLCRHLLGLQAIGTNKAQSMAARLNESCSHARAVAIDAKFPVLDGAARELLHECDLVLDCTGADETLHELSIYPWNSQKLFVSVALSYRAKRLYVFGAEGQLFPMNEFQQALEPWLQKDADEFAGEELIQDGIGCWHAAFPARIDDVWLLSSVAVRCLEEFLNSDSREASLTVYEQVSAGYAFAGVKKGRIMTEGAHEYWSEDRQFGVLLPATVVDEILTQAQRSGSVETGGILIGRYSSGQNCALVDQATGPPDDSKRARSWFVRGVNGLQSLLNGIWRVERRYYLGEWHYHPGQSASPSPDDTAQMGRIAGSEDYACPEPVLVILGGFPTGKWHIRTFVYPKGQQPVELG